MKYCSPETLRKRHRQADLVGTKQRPTTERHAQKQAGPDVTLNRAMRRRMKAVQR